MGKRVFTSYVYTCTIDIRTCTVHMVKRIGSETLEIYYYHYNKSLSW